MKGPKILLCCLLMTILVAGSITYWTLAHQQKKIAVIDAVKLFNGYNMKKELEDIAKVKLQAESKQLDSIANTIRMAKAITKDEQEARKLSYQYEYVKKRLDDDYTQSDHDINTQVWKRLNPLLDEFGRKNGLHLIIGANGMGSVLYTDEYYDLTNDAIQFINKRYAEGN